MMNSQQALRVRRSIGFTRLAVGTLRRALSSSEGVQTEQEIRNQTDRIIETILRPINTRMQGPLEKQSDGDALVPMPFVFLLGNHSSGKSTFINHVYGRQVQTTGVAPTDDCFTVIAPGVEDTDRDGPALIGNPDMGFGSLRAFGPNLINHTLLKVRSDIAEHGFMMVDSPGMIDSPGQGHGMGAFLSDDEDDPLRSSRGYDFKGVTRWFAERADVILLFFDPDKPGTTGETLQILTSSLSGLDHKLHIILNKADQFYRVNDFARAYGSLCWNLSKVIPRKDLPRIYTMCLPVEDNQKPQSRGDGMWLAREDLEAARSDVISEVKKAPLRRNQNMITRVYDSARLLRMHLVVQDAVRTEYKKSQRMLWLTSGGILTLGNCAAGACIPAGLPPHIALGASFATVLAGAANHYTRRKMLSEQQEDLCTDDGLSHIFRKSHLRELAEGDQFIVSLWDRVRPNLKQMLSLSSVHSTPKLASADLRQIDEIITKEVPHLRRMAAPAPSSLQ